MPEYLSPTAASLFSLMLNAEVSALPDEYIQRALRNLGPEEGKMLVDALQKTSKGSKKKWAGKLKKWADRQLVPSQ